MGTPLENNTTALQDILAAVRASAGGGDYVPLTAEEIWAIIGYVPIRTLDITASNISEYFTVTNASYYFAGNGGTFTTNNGGVGSSTAKTTLKALYDMAVAFTYSYSSESGYDKFTLKVGSTTVANAVSGSTTTKQYAGKITAGTEIMFQYSKDGGADSYNDQCTFSAMTVTGKF